MEYFAAITRSLVALQMLLKRDWKSFSMLEQKLTVKNRLKQPLSTSVRELWGEFFHENHEI